MMPEPPVAMAPGPAHRRELIRGPAIVAALSKAASLKAASLKAASPTQSVLTSDVALAVSSHRSQRVGPPSLVCARL